MRVHQFNNIPLSPFNPSHNMLKWIILNQNLFYNYLEWHIYINIENYDLFGTWNVNVEIWNGLTFWDLVVLTKRKLARSGARPADRRVWRPLVQGSRLVTADSFALCTRWTKMRLRTLPRLAWWWRKEGSCVAAAFAIALDCRAPPHRSLP